MISYDWVVVSVNYRLNTKAGYPTQLMDCKRALRWVKDEIRVFGGNPSNIVAAGDSAGGQMACLLASTANQLDLQPGFESVDTTVQGVLGLSAVVNLVDTENYYNHGGRSRFIKEVAKREGSPESAETCTAPITYLEVPGGHHCFHLISSPRTWYMIIAASQWLNYHFEGIRGKDGEIVEWDWD
ncbi:TLE member 5 [Modicella reniformis]|uniref:TLE member 5 n=1 Tax=Modicella reniformis TaxID=1440133 RepID=A0A9P6IX54_9FUNG|nr:TLE member 5 [Modicella reniformis]